MGRTVGDTCSWRWQVPRLLFVGVLAIAPRYTWVDAFATTHRHRPAPPRARRCALAPQMRGWARRVYPPTAGSVRKAPPLVCTPRVGRPAGARQQPFLQARRMKWDVHHGPAPHQRMDATIASTPRTHCEPLRPRPSPSTVTLRGPRPPRQPPHDPHHRTRAPMRRPPWRRCWPLAPPLEHPH